MSDLQYFLTVNPDHRYLFEKKKKLKTKQIFSIFMRYLFKDDSFNKQIKEIREYFEIEFAFVFLLDKEEELTLNDVKNCIKKFDIDMTSTVLSNLIKKNIIKDVDDLFFLLEDKEIVKRVTLLPYVLNIVFEEIATDWPKSKQVLEYKSSEKGDFLFSINVFTLDFLLKREKDNKNLSYIEDILSFFEKRGIKKDALCIISLLYLYADTGEEKKFLEEIEGFYEKSHYDFLNMQNNICKAIDSFSLVTPDFKNKIQEYPLKKNIPLFFVFKNSNDSMKRIIRNSILKPKRNPAKVLFKVDDSWKGNENLENKIEEIKLIIPKSLPISFQEVFNCIYELNEGYEEKERLLKIANEFFIDYFYLESVGSLISDNYFNNIDEFILCLNYLHSFLEPSKGFYRKCLEKLKKCHFWKNIEIINHPLFSKINESSKLEIQQELGFIQN